MSQVYFLEILYLVFGSLLLLSDTHGIKYPLLLSFRYTFRTKRSLRLTLIWSGVLLTILSLFIPYEPGPILLGDLVMSIALLCLTLWYVAQDTKKNDSQQGVFDEVGSYIERNRKNWGFVILAVACIHFVVPGCVLL